MYVRYPCDTLVITHLLPYAAILVSFGYHPSVHLPLVLLHVTYHLVLLCDCPPLPVSLGAAG